MISKKESWSLYVDVCDLAQEIYDIQQEYIHTRGIPDMVFRHQIVSRVKEVLDVALNIDRAAFNRKHAR